MKKVLIPTKLNVIAKETLEATGTYEVVQQEGANLLDLAAERLRLHHVGTLPRPSQSAA